MSDYYKRRREVISYGAESSSITIIVASEIAAGERSPLDLSAEDVMEMARFTAAAGMLSKWGTEALRLERDSAIKTVQEKIAAKFKNHEHPVRAAADWLDEKAAAEFRFREGRGGRPVYKTDESGAAQFVARYADIQREINERGTRRPNLLSAQQIYDIMTDSKISVKS